MANTGIITHIIVGRNPANSNNSVLNILLCYTSVKKRIKYQSGLCVYKKIHLADPDLHMSLASL